MTFLEKAKLEFPKMEEDEIIGECPQDFNLEKKSICPEGGCIKCWNREMPNTEAKDELKERLELIDELKLVEYNKGLNDAWELCKKLLCDNPQVENLNAFGYVWTSDIIRNYTPQEAIAKLKAYEEAQSKVVVGDVVTEGNRTFIVTHISCDCVFGLLPDGDLYSVPKISDCKKTGKHIDISSILEQIGE